MRHMSHICEAFLNLAGVADGSPRSNEQFQDYDQVRMAPSPTTSLPRCNAAGPDCVTVEFGSGMSEMK